MSSGRIIFAGPVNVVGDERLSIDGSKGRRLRLADITEFDSGVYRCQVEVRTRPISLEHTLNVLGKQLQRCAKKIDPGCVMPTSSLPLAAGASLCNLGLTLSPNSLYRVTHQFDENLPLTLK